MRILLCTSENGLNAGGLALHCAQLKEIYEELGHTVFVDIISRDLDSFIVDGGYDPNLGNKIRFSSLLKETIKKYEGQVDICVSCGAGRTAYYSMLFCRAVGIPLYVVLCGSEINLAFEDEKLSFYNSEALSYSSTVIGLSEELCNNAKLLASKGNSCYYMIPNYCNMDDHPLSVPSKKEDGLVFVTGAAHLNEKKGISNLILAFSKHLRNSSRNDKLYLIGEIDDDVKVQYEKLITENEAENIIFLCGYENRENFCNRILESDVYIQASPFEGLNNSLADAIRLGTDILITDTGYIAEQIRPAYPDHILNSLDTDDMAVGITRFAEEIMPKTESDGIRSLLLPLMSRESVVAQWKSILAKPQCNYSLEDNTCLSVMFHDVGSEHSGIDYSVYSFRKLVKALYVRGYRMCSAHDYFRLNPESKKNSIVCTFDDGYENVYLNALPIMKEFDYTATVYICPDLIGKTNSWNHKDKENRKHLTKPMLKALVDAGWEIGSHGMSHINLLRLSEHELEKNLSDSKNQLAEYGKIESFCYPYGEYNAFIMDKVRQYYQNAFSVTIGGRDYTNNRFQITRMDPEDLLTMLENI